MKTDQSGRQDVRLALLRLGAVVCFGSGLAVIGLDFNCQLFIVECGAVRLSGYFFLGLMVFLTGIVLQWGVSSGLTNFVYRLFIGVGMGIGLWGLATTVEGLLR